MQKTKLQKILSFIVCIVLIAAMALVTTGCKDNQKGMTKKDMESVPKEEIKVLGEGENEFILTVTDDKGEVTTFEIHTDKTIVGEALQDLDLISGKEEQYGLYITTVCGMTFEALDDGKYWSFYVDGEYAQKGIDSTEIQDGTVYSLVVEKA